MHCAHLFLFFILAISDHRVHPHIADQPFLQVDLTSNNREIVAASRSRTAVEDVSDLSVVCEQVLSALAGLPEGSNQAFRRVSLL